MLVYGGNFLKATDNIEPTNKDFVTMLLVVVRLIGHISVIEHFSEDFSKEKLVDSSLKNYVLGQRTNKTYF